MNLFETTAQALVWDLDFFPARPWPALLPVIVAKREEKLWVIAGFERAILPQLMVLEVESSVSDALAQFWPDDTLRPLERLRLHAKLGRSVPMDFLKDWPLVLQRFFDERDLGLKSLKPLEFLADWRHDISDSFLKLNPTSSQVREVIDLICDLKLTDKFTWAQLAPESSSDSVNAFNAWIAKLRLLRHPKTASKDKEAAENIGGVSWPRGIRAKWDRQGDQAGILIQTKVTNHTEWLRLKANLQKLEIGESLWPRSP